MKKVMNFSVILGCLLALGLAFTACGGGAGDSGGGGGTTYTVTFNVNGGNGTAPAAQTVNAGSAVTLPSGSGLSKSNFTFGGWNTNNSGTGTNYNAGESYTPTASITLYAKWNAGGPNTYTVTFNVNEGNGTAPAPQTVNAGSPVTLPSGSGLTRTGYAFSGWNTHADGTGANYNAGASYTPTAPIVLYAKWEVTTYTIAFDTNGASGTAPTARTVTPGYSTSLPTMSWATVTLTGWNTKADGTGTTYAVNSTYTPSGNIAAITLYAQWDIPSLASVTGLANKLAWLQNFAQSDTSYTLDVDADESIDPPWLSYGGSGITITLQGVGTNRTVSLSDQGGEFTVDDGVTLILDNNIILQGRANTSASLVSVVPGGVLRMNAGSKITGNTQYLSGGALGGGGVMVAGGTFTMSGGEISGNNIFSGYGSTPSYAGGGVFVAGGTFTMSGGTISGNTAGSGGGVFVAGGTFTMSGGIISGNTAGSGAGVSVDGSGYYGTTFTMSGGTISGNTATASGGGVYVYNGTFTMNNGTISGNTATTSGGGVYMSSGTFNKTGGTITGYGSDTVNGNVVKNSSGTVQSNQGHAIYATGGGTTIRKETTAGTGVNLSFIGSNGNYSGSWDN